jgi:hypothetical protein
VSPELEALELADSPQKWEALGFSVRHGTCQVGGVRLELGADGHGITGWRLAGIPGGTREIDGLRSSPAARPSPGEPSPAPDHPNGAIAVDHVVITSPNFDRTVTALQASGMGLRRVAERGDGARMGFRRLGAAILELVETTGAESGPARLWGLVIVVEDLRGLAERLGEDLGSIREAVQPGRQIATLGESAGLGQAVGFMSPESPSCRPLRSI